MTITVVGCTSQQTFTVSRIGTAPAGHVNAKYAERLCEILKRQPVSCYDYTQQMKIFLRPTATLLNANNLPSCSKTFRGVQIYETF